MAKTIVRCIPSVRYTFAIMTHIDCCSKVGQSDSISLITEVMMHYRP